MLPSLGKPVPSPHLVGWSRGAHQPVAEGCREEDSQVLIPDTMDSHMHLDKSLRRLRMDPRMGIQEPLARRPRPAHFKVLDCIPKGFAPSLQSIPTSPMAVTAGESNSLDRRSK
jgi:hypothetical protein